MHNTRQAAADRKIVTAVPNKGQIIFLTPCVGCVRTAHSKLSCNHESDQWPEVGLAPFLALHSFQVTNQSTEIVHGLADTSNDAPIHANKLICITHVRTPTCRFFSCIPNENITISMWLGKLA